MGSCWQQPPSLRGVRSFSHAGLGSFSEGGARGAIRNRRSSQPDVRQTSSCMRVVSAIPTSMASSFETPRRSLSSGARSRDPLAMLLRMRSAFPGCCAALLRCAADPGSICTQSPWVPALRCIVKDAAPRPGHEIQCFTSSQDEVSVPHGEERVFARLRTMLRIALGTMRPREKRQTL